MARYLVGAGIFAFSFMVTMESAARSPSAPIIMLICAGGFVICLLAFVATRKKSPAVKYSDPTPSSPQPILPPPNPPAPLTTPIKGLMRVDVTQTNQTVDVYILRSEQDSFVITAQQLGDIPIEQHFEELKEHLSRYRRISARSWEVRYGSQAGQMRVRALESFQKQSKEW